MKNQNILRTDCRTVSMKVTSNEKDSLPGRESEMPYDLGRGEH